MNTWLIVDYGGVLAEDHAASAQNELSKALANGIDIIRAALSEKSFNGRALRLDQMTESSFWNAICSEVSPRAHLPPPAQELTRLWANCYEIRTGVAEVLREVRSLGVHTGIATNVDRYREQYLLAELARCSVNAKVWSSYRIGFLKPNIEYFRYIQNEISYRSEVSRCFYVDDRQTHVDAASSIGWEACRASQAQPIRAWLRQQNILK